MDAVGKLLCSGRRVRACCSVFAILLLACTMAGHCNTARLQHPEVIPRKETVLIPAQLVGTLKKGLTDLCLGVIQNLGVKLSDSKMVLERGIPLFLMIHTG